MADKVDTSGTAPPLSEALAAQNPLDLARRQLSFIQNIIDKTLVRQPQSVQAIVLFIFVFLFVYMVIFTTGGSFILSTKLRVPATPQQRALIPVDASGFAVPQGGYQIIFNDRYYGLNSNGQVRIDLSVMNYLWALASRELSIDVRPPGTIEYTLSLRLKGLELEPIAFGKLASDGLGSIDLPWELGGFAAQSPTRSLSLISRAEADTLSSLRLYIQSVTVSNKLDANEVNATLTLPDAKRPLSLVALAGNLGSSAESPLLVTAGVPLIHNYQTFFALSQPSSTSLRSGGQIKLQAPAKLFSSGVSETYDLPELAVGVPVAVRGSAEGSLVVQLAYPVDVIFFERRDTAPLTETLMSRVAEKGYVPRLNLTSARIAGEYNVVYAGDEVPLAALKEVVGIISSNGARLRSIQPQRHLTNGIQNQIQVGSSLSVVCLDVIGQTALRELTQAQSDSVFLAAVSKLPHGSCTQ